MAQPIRSAKSGSDWTDAELLAYNISITPTSPDFFFRSNADPSLDHLDPAILTSPNAEDPDLSEATTDYLGYLDLDDFAIRAAQADGCVIYCPITVLLVLIKDQTLFNKPDAEAQVAAEAIAAFQFNNIKRAARGQSVLEELSDAVKTAQYPTSPTRVLKCVIVAAAQSQRRISDGMADTEFRKLALKRFVVFKSLARRYWQQYLA
ncbi:hypothetical protein CPB84DRAFT_1817543 [Gymnopilus junonius]|uniref:Uncharacterized protein n=1 Tax=Gymnopilus junonius TaxID=109634 RepID=A0A9P5NAB2_GYMJU|nr:hypothetical protein CPB84DRAFT_1817543 [Gymnopilus junonius]